MIEIVKQGALIRNAVFWSPDGGCIVAGDKEADEENLAQSLIFVLADEKQPTFHFLEWIAHAICLLPTGGEALVSSDEGRLLTVSPASIDEGHITFAEGWKRPIVLRSLSLIAAQVFGVGMNGLIIRRRSDGLWERTAGPDFDRSGLEAADGFSLDEIYVVGWDGTVVWLQGNRLVDCSAPTSVILTDIACADDGFAYACGQEGVLLRGRRDRWEVICAGATDENLWGIADYRGKIYVATILSLYTVEDAGLAPVDFGEDPPTSCYKLFVGHGFLWSIGREDILRFDGSVWMRVA
jgi:hypothetical protein